MSKNNLVEINADMFIIPNHAYSIDRFFWFDKVGEKEYADNSLKFYKDLYAANGKEYSEDEPLVQIWITNDNSENIIRHGFIIYVEDKRYYADSSTLSDLENCPKCLIDIKEGESCDLLVKNVKVHDIDDDKESVIVDILFHLTANQSEYRYRNFGTFDETMKKVCY